MLIRSTIIKIIKRYKKQKEIVLKFQYDNIKTKDLFFFLVKGLENKLIKVTRYKRFLGQKKNLIICPKKERNIDIPTWKSPGSPPVVLVVAPTKLKVCLLRPPAGQAESEA